MNVYKNINTTDRQTPGLNLEEAGEFLYQTVSLDQSNSQRQPALTRQKLLKAHSNISVPILVIPLEHIRHAPQSDTRLNEKIKAHLTPRRPIAIHLPTLALISRE